MTVLPGVLSRLCTPCVSNLLTTRFVAPKVKGSPECCTSPGHYTLTLLYLPLQAGTLLSLALALLLHP